MKRDHMLASLREDYLEAIRIFSDTNARGPSREELGVALGRSGPELGPDLAELRSRGDILFADDGTIVLTEEGDRIGKRVIKKHETLQCFLKEILGMDDTSASTEACTLEHAVSDETIDRLGEYLKKPKPSDTLPDKIPGAGARPRNAAVPADPCSPFSLLDFKEGDELIVRCILGQASAKRLLDLGVVPGERVKIRRKLGNRALVLQVKGCDVALSPEIASAVSVERCP